MLAQKNQTKLNHSPQRNPVSPVLCHWWGKKKDNGLVGLLQSRPGSLQESLSLNSADFAGFNSIYKVMVWFDFFWWQDGSVACRGHHVVPSSVPAHWGCERWEDLRKGSELDIFQLHHFSHLFSHAREKVASGWELLARIATDQIKLSGTAAQCILTALEGGLKHAQGLVYRMKTSLHG